MSDAQLYSDSMKSASFDYRVFTDYMRTVRSKTFKFLYDFQIKSSGYRRFDFTASQLRLMLPTRKESSRGNPKKYILFIDSDFISKRDRLPFKRSAFYGKEISMYDIANNPELFKSSYIIFIEGKFIDCTNLICKEDNTCLIIDTNEWENTAGLPPSYIEDMITRDVPITVFFMPNPVYGIYETNVNVIAKYENYLSLAKFDIAGNLTDEATYISFINSNELLYASVMCDTSADQFLKFYAGNDALPFDTKLAHFNVFGMRNVLDEVVLPAGETFFEIPIMNYPVPVETMIVFRDVSGRKEYAHDVTIRLHYPNIYKIEVNDQPAYDLHIFTIGVDDTPMSGDLKYKNQLGLYYRFFANDILDKYKDDTIPGIIKNYDEGEYNYSLPDYFGNAFDPDHLTYKIERFNGFIENDPMVINEYFHELFKPVQNYMIDISEIDLATRLRTDNLGEISSVDDHTTFAEDRYVFQFIEYSGVDKTLLSLFIDGNYYMPDVTFSEDGMKYVYIPTTMVNADSFIEVNVDALFSFEEQTVFTATNEIIEFNCNNSNKPVMACDIYLINEQDNTYVDRADFEIYVLDDFGNQTAVGSSTARNIHDTFFVSITNASLVDVNISVRVDKVGYIQEWVSTGGFGGVLFPVQVNNNTEYFKIYRDGRLIPKNAYAITTSNIHGTSTIVDLGIVKNIGDRFIIQYTPNRYTQTLFLDDIPSNGIVEVGDILNRPFDYHTYEYYINGKKLNRTNLEILTPHTLLLKDVESLQNFEILTKNIDEEQFFIYGNALTEMNTLIYNLAEFQSEVIANLPILPDTEPPLAAILDPGALIYVGIFIYLLPTLEFINPDTDQITADDVTQYEPVLTTPFVLNPDADGHGDEPNPFQKLYINPDVDFI